MTAIATSTPAEFCKACVKHPDTPCPSCAARRKKAIALYEAGEMTIGEIASDMGLSVLKVMRLIEEEFDRRELEQRTRAHRRRHACGPT
jgi:hypothetical protein